MDLLKLAAKIELDDSSYNKGLSNAEKAAQSLQGKMSAMTVAMGNIAADLIRKGVSAVQSIVGGAVDAYADYEQLVGGVETLFKQSSGKVQKYAKESFRTTGLSANEYMETVTSFSASLLQGLDGNTELAADLANMAITDMADNANKMGTDISSIQNAYQGFAKQNYTMLDNLKLGYGGTASEMVRLINDSGILEDKIDDLDGITFDQLVMAIHQIQTEMGITGTTASEAAETISGSKASLAAAWKDLLSTAGGQSDEEFYTSLDNFKESFSTYMENFIPSLILSIKSSGSIATAIGEAVSDLPAELLSQVAEAGLDAGTGVIKGAGEVVGWLIDSLANVFSSISADSSQVETFAASIGEFIGTTLTHIATNIPTFAQGLLDAGKALADGLFEGLIKGLFGEEAEVDNITESLQSGLTDINVNNAKATALINYLDGLIAKYGEGAQEMEEWKEAQAELEKVMPDAGDVFEDYGQDIGGAVDKLKELNEELRNAAIINALQKASQDELELLTTQTLEFNKQKRRYERNQSALETYTEPMRNALQTIAEQRRQSIEERQAAGEFVGGDEIALVSNILNGMADLGNGLQNLSELSLGDLNSLIRDLYSGGLIPEEYRFDDYIETYQPLIAEAQAEMKSASSEMASISEEMDATKAAIAETNEAMAMTASQLLSSGIAGAQSIRQAAGALADAIASAGKGGETYMPQATGMEYVPFDGFKASLHRGERIVPAAENKKMSGGKVDIAGLEDSIAAAIRDGMEGVVVKSYLNGKDITADVSRNIINDLKARRYGA